MTPLLRVRLSLLKRTDTIPDAVEFERSNSKNIRYRQNIAVYIFIGASLKSEFELATHRHQYLKLEHRIKPDFEISKTAFVYSPEL